MEYHFGSRDSSFKNAISRILKMCNLTQEHIDLILDEEGMSCFSMCFTHESIHPDRNYELLEFIGDPCVNKVLAWYLFRQFPQLRQSSDLKNIQRMFSQLKSQSYLTSMALSTFPEFYNFVSCEMDTYKKNRDKIMEDIFEAFCGSVEYLVDLKIGIGVGQSCIYNFITSILDKREIQIDYENSSDPVTRLKEIMDQMQSKNIKYETKYVNNKFKTDIIFQNNAGNKVVKAIYEENYAGENPEYKKIISCCLQYRNIVKECLKLTKFDHSEVNIGFGVHNTKIKSRKAAARNALTYLEKNKDILK